MLTSSGMVSVMPPPLTRNQPQFGALCLLLPPPPGALFVRLPRPPLVHPLGSGHRRGRFTCDGRPQCPLPLEPAERLTDHRTRPSGGDHLLDQVAVRGRRSVRTLHFEIVFVCSY